MEMSVTEVIFSFLGGLGIFLYGLKIMGDGLQASAGDRLRDILNKFTSNPVLGVIAGIVVTILIQSSSGTTVITIGLVTAGFMTLKQAIGVIMGANIGNNGNRIYYRYRFRRICNANFSIRCIFNLFL